MGQADDGEGNRQSARAKGHIVADRLTDLTGYLTEMIAGESSVVAVYLFGSGVSELATEESDLDLAFLVDHEAYNSDPLRAVSSAFTIATRIGMRLSKEADVTILNGSSVEMAYEVVTTGQCIYQADPDMRLEYEAKARGMYFDFRPFLLEMRSRCLASL